MTSNYDELVKLKSELQKLMLDQQYVVQELFMALRLNKGDEEIQKYLDEHRQYEKRIQAVIRKIQELVTSVD